MAAGLGHRRFLARELAVGVHLFFDYSRRSENRRNYYEGSLGGEVYWRRYPLEARPLRERLCLTA